MVCLPLEYLPGWLFGLNASKVRAGLADKIMYYRRECFHVLWQAFKADILPPTPPAGDLSGAALAYEIATAVQHLARQEMELEVRLGEVAGKQEVIADYVRKFIQDYRQRGGHSFSGADYAGVYVAWRSHPFRVMPRPRKRMACL